MKFEDIYKLIEIAILPYVEHSFFAKEFLDCLCKLSEDETASQVIKATKITILLEGFYQSLPPDNVLKNDIRVVRLKRWKNHFGTPTITFLISYDDLISQIYSYFNGAQHIAYPIILKILCNIDKAKNLVDAQNNIVVNVAELKKIALPEIKETTGHFIKTHNPKGGFATTPCDPYSIKFIEHVSSLAKNGCKVLEIGAAFGAASLEVLAKGASVFCNDIEAKNLAVIRERYLRESRSSSASAVTGDDEQLVLVPGSFPEELVGLPKESFDAILICRVLHFFTGKKIEESLRVIFGLLKPGGRLFIVCETPFLKNWQAFKSEYERRVALGVEWPGEITTPAEFESSGRAESLPLFVHWMTKEVIDRSLSRTHFAIASSSYINRLGQFPSDLVLDGKESVGAEAVKAM